MNELKVFQNSEFGELSVLTIDGKEYFPASQCAKILGYSNPYDAIKKHCKEDGVVKREGVSYTTNQYGVTSRQTTEIKYISESNLYRLIIRSKLPAAEKFERWVFDEVLPELRKTGSYGNSVNLEEVIAKTANAVKVLMRDGEKAFNDRCLPYMVRMYDELEANECWIADNHTFDVQTLDDEGKIHRLYLTAFLDAKSGVLTGWNITDTPNSWSTILALRHGISRFGIPKCVYFDNGREFLTHDVGGRGHRNHGSRKDIAVDPPTILKRLGIEMRNAIVRNAKAKPIERTFGTVKSQFSKIFKGYCGGTILERPESLKRRVKNGNLPRDYEIRDFFETWIDGDYNLQTYGGSEPCYKEMTRLDVWNKTCKSVRQASPEELNLMMMRSTRYQKIKRNGVYIEMFGEKLWYMDLKQTVLNLEKEVYVRYDPANLESVRVYDKDDKYLYTWKLADHLLVDYLSNIKEDIANGQKYIRTVGKFVKEQTKGISANISNEQKITMLDMTMRKAYERKDKIFKINMPSNIIPIKANEPDFENVKQAAGAEGTVIIDLKKMERNSLKRKED